MIIKKKNTYTLTCDECNKIAVENVELKFCIRFLNQNKWKRLYKDTVHICRECNKAILFKDVEIKDTESKEG